MKRDALPAATLTALFAALPLAGANNYILGIAIQALLYTVVAASLNLVWGYAGLLSFAQLAFWGQRTLRLVCVALSNVV